MIYCQKVVPFQSLVKFCILAHQIIQTMKKNDILILGFILVVIFLEGCLTCEKKEYSFKFTGDNAGILTIKFINLMSTMDDTLDISEEDFQSLINDYYNGNTLESEYPTATLIGKRLYEQDGQLCGEIQLEFKDLAGANLYRHEGKGPYMFCLNCNSIAGETFEASNGTYGGDVMPVVFWDSGLHELNLNTVVTYPDETTVSLVEEFRLWESIK